MSKIINSDLRSVAGMTIYPPQYKRVSETGEGNLDLPNPYLSDVVQKFPLGTKLRWGDRTWVYCKLGATEGGNTYHVDGPLRCLVADDMIPQALTAIAGAAGASVITCTNAGTPGVNGYAGGYMHMRPGGSVDDVTFRALTCGVIGNTAAGTTIYLDTPLPATISAVGGEVIPSPYHQVVAMSQASMWLNRMVVGIYNSPTSDLAATTTVSGNWLWVQSWGPCVVGTVHARSSGNTNARFNTVGDGGCWQPIDATYTYAEQAGYQHGGFAMFDQTDLGTISSNGNFIFITISP